MADADFNVKTEGDKREELADWALYTNHKRCEYHEDCREDIARRRAQANGVVDLLDGVLGPDALHKGVLVADAYARNSETNGFKKLAAHQRDLARRLYVMLNVLR